MAKLYHINIENDIKLPRYLLTCGDPSRARWISEEFLTNSKELANNREYHSFIGQFKGLEIVVSSMGIGSPSTAIGLEEFAMCGVDTFIRVGTAGSLSPNVKHGSIVNVTGAVRDEGTSKQYVPIEYPAIANLDVILAIRKSAQKLQINNYFEGIAHSKDSFYSEHPEYTPQPELLKSKWKTWTLSNVLATEMECSILFVLSQLRNWRSGSVLAIIGETWAEKPILGNPKSGQKEAILSALESFVILDEKN